MAIKVGNAPVSWGVYEAHLPNPPFGPVLDAIAEAGYDGTELGPFGYLPTEEQALDRELRTRRLALGSSFVPVKLAYPEERQAAVETAERVAQLLATQGVGEIMIADAGSPARTAVAGRVPADGSAGWSDSEWQEAIHTLHTIGRDVALDLGMRVIVHHHAGTYLETPAEIERLLAGTDPEVVHLLLDTGHLVYGGGDPVAFLEKHADRVTYVHLKDVNPTMLEKVRAGLPMDDAWKQGVFCPLGEGMVDFPRFIDTLRAHGYDGWAIVEQDVVPDAQGKLHPDPFESAKRSRQYLAERCGLVGRR